jgi:uncharacterized protein (DUF1697 family)
MKYVAFLRGINVGGNRVLKMADVKAAFEAAGMTGVNTILASGNIVFESATKDTAKPERTLEQQLEATFGHQIGVFVRTAGEMGELVTADPFKRRQMTPETRLYVMFLASPPPNKPKTPFKGPVGDLQVLRVTDRELCAIMTVTADVKTPDAMNAIGKLYGPKITTRNWNTVQKVAKAMQ